MSAKGKGISGIELPISSSSSSSSAMFYTTPPPPPSPQEQQQQQQQQHRRHHHHHHQQQQEEEEEKPLRGYHGAPSPPVTHPSCLATSSAVLEGGRGGGKGENRYPEMKADKVQSALQLFASIKENSSCIPPVGGGRNNHHNSSSTSGGGEKSCTSASSARTTTTMMTSGVGVAGSSRMYEVYPTSPQVGEERGVGGAGGVGVSPTSFMNYTYPSRPQMSGIESVFSSPFTSASASSAASASSSGSPMTSSGREPPLLFPPPPQDVLQCPSSAGMTFPSQQVATIFSPAPKMLSPPSLPNSHRTSHSSTTGGMGGISSTSSSTPLMSGESFPQEIMRIMKNTTTTTGGGGEWSRIGNSGEGSGGGSGSGGTSSRSTPLALLAMKEANEVMAMYEGTAGPAIQLKQESGGGGKSGESEQTEEKSNAKGPGRTEVVPPHNNNNSSSSSSRGAARRPASQRLRRPGSSVSRRGGGGGGRQQQPQQDGRMTPMMRASNPPHHRLHHAAGADAGGGEGDVDGIKGKKNKIEENGEGAAADEGGEAGVLPLASTAMLEYFGASSEAQLKSMSSRELIRKLAVSEAILKRLHERNKLLLKQLEEAKGEMSAMGVNSSSNDHNHHNGGEEVWKTSNRNSMESERQLAAREMEVNALHHRLRILQSQHESVLTEKDRELDVAKEKQMRLATLLGELEGKMTRIGKGGDGGEDLALPRHALDHASGAGEGEKREVRGAPGKRAKKFFPHSQRHDHVAYDGGGAGQVEEEEEEEEEDSLLARIHRLEVEKELLSSHLFQAEKQNRLLEDKLQKNTKTLEEHKRKGVQQYGGSTPRRDEIETEDKEGGKKKAGGRGGFRSHTFPPPPPPLSSHPTSLELNSFQEETPPSSWKASEQNSKKFSSYLTVLQDHITNLRYRLQRQQVEVRKLENVQVKALLESPSTPVARINDDVKQLFTLLKDRLVSEAIHHEAERQRMNEVMYALEKEISSVGL